MEFQQDIRLLGEGDQLLHTELGQQCGLPLPPDLLGQSSRARRGLGADLEAIDENDVRQSHLGQVIGKTRSERSGANDDRFGRAEHRRFLFVYWLSGISYWSILVLAVLPSSCRSHGT